MDDNLLWQLDNWRRNHLFVDLLKVVNVAYLRGLCDAFTMRESFPSVVSNRICGTVSKTREYKKAAN